MSANTSTVAIWMVIDNIILFLVSVGLAAGFFIYTGSGWSFLWLLLLIMLNTVEIGKGGEATSKNITGIGQK